MAAWAWYKAENVRLRSFVALKFLPAQMAHDRAALGRFRPEAEASSALNHPSICTIYDIGEQDGEHFIAMEFLDGQTLKHLIVGRPMEIEIVPKLAIQIPIGTVKYMLPQQVKGEELDARSDLFFHLVWFCTR